MVNKALVGALILGLVFSPISGVAVQASIVWLWDLIILELGAYITLIAGLYVVFWVGLRLYQSERKERVTTAKNVSKAKKSKRKVPVKDYITT